MKGSGIRALVLVAVVLATISSFAVAAATAAAPDRETFKFSFDYTDTDTCSFPISVHGDFTNMIIDSSLATGTGTLQLHQRDVETWMANGVTLHANGEYTIFVTIVNGIPQTAKHVGVLDFLLGPNGHHLFLDRRSRLPGRVRPGRRVLRRRAVDRQTWRA